MFLQMPELSDTKVQIMILAAKYVRRASIQAYRHMKERGSILTPTHATVVPRLFRIGNICRPFVTELSRLGLKASPENSVISFGWFAYCESKR